MDVVMMYRPTGPQEHDLIVADDFRTWPPRLPEQPIFYPVTNEAYATEITRRWNVPMYGVGYVFQFAVKKAFADRYQKEHVGGKNHTEWWIPAADLDELNQNIVGPIVLVAEYRDTL